MREVVCNTSPVQYLHQIGRLDLLHRLYDRLIVPVAVVEELAVGRANGVDLPAVETIEWMIPARARVIDILPLVADLGKGEREALALAKERAPSLLIIDDYLARRHAELLSITFTGTLGVLLRAKREGMVDKVEDCIVGFEKAGFRLSVPTRQLVLRMAGEIDCFFATEAFIGLSWAPPRTGSLENRLGESRLQRQGEGAAHSGSR